MLAALIMLILVCAWHGLATKMPVGDLGDVLDSGAFWFFVLLFVAFNVIFIIILSMKVRICGLAIIAFFLTHVCHLFRDSGRQSLLELQLAVNISSYLIASRSMVRGVEKNRNF